MHLSILLLSPFVVYACAFHPHAVWVELQQPLSNQLYVYCIGHVDE